MLSTSNYTIENFNIYELKQTSSTNDALKEFPNLSPYTLITALTQTKGRGRRGRTWQSPKGNLYFSYSFIIPIKDLNKLVFIISLSLAQTVKNISPSSQSIKIKWPNDVLLNNKKISGILLENLKEDLWIIGIGVNIVSSPKLTEVLYEATSLQEEGIILDRIKFLHYYLKNFNKNYEIYTKEGFSKIKEQWLEFAHNYHQPINIKTEKELKIGIFSAIDDNGYLILKTNDKEEKIIAGDLFI